MGIKTFLVYSGCTSFDFVCLCLINQNQWVWISAADFWEGQKKPTGGHKGGKARVDSRREKGKRKEIEWGNLWDIPQVNVWREWRIMGCWARASFHPWKSFHWLTQILNKALPEWACASVEISEAKTKIITVLNGLHWLTSLVSNVLWQCFILIIPSGDNCVISSIKLKHKSIQLVTSLMSCCLKTHMEI